jgi:hypothetical protein
MPTNEDNMNPLINVILLTYVYMDFEKNPVRKFTEYSTPTNALTVYHILV